MSGSLRCGADQQSLTFARRDGRQFAVIATTAYPIVLAHEYECLKKEAEIQRRMQGATIYFILQRPLTFFSNVVPEDGELLFDIWDGVNSPVHCQIKLTDLGIPAGEEALLDVQCFRDPASKIPPFQEVAALRLLKKDGTFVYGKRHRTFYTM